VVIRRKPLLFSLYFV